TSVIYTLSLHDALPIWDIIPGMTERKRGHIINIGSIAGKEVYPNGNVYCASKFAVDALTRGMRMDLNAFGIKVTSINPGLVETRSEEHTSELQSQSNLV